MCWFLHQITSRLSQSPPYTLRKIFSKAKRLRAPIRVATFQTKVLEKATPGIEAGTTAASGGCSRPWLGAPHLRTTRGPGRGRPGRMRATSSTRTATAQSCVSCQREGAARHGHQCSTRWGAAAGGKLAAVQGMRNVLICVCDMALPAEDGRPGCQQGSDVRRRPSPVLRAQEQQRHQAGKGIDGKPAGRGRAELRCALSARPAKVCMPETNQHACQSARPAGRACCPYNWAPADPMRGRPAHQRGPPPSPAHLKFMSSGHSELRRRRRRAGIFSRLYRSWSLACVWAGLGMGWGGGRGGGHSLVLLSFSMAVVMGGSRAGMP